MSKVNCPDRRHQLNSRPHFISSTASGIPPSLARGLPRNLDHEVDRVIGA